MAGVSPHHGRINGLLVINGSTIVHHKCYYVNMQRSLINIVIIRSKNFNHFNVPTTLIECFVRPRHAHVFLLNFSRNV